MKPGISGVRAYSYIAEPDATPILGHVSDDVLNTLVSPYSKTCSVSAVSLPIDTVDTPQVRDAGRDSINISWQWRGSSDASWVVEISKVKGSIVTWTESRSDITRSGDTLSARVTGLEAGVQYQV